MPKKRPSLNHQMHNRMENLKLFGESKHEAKAKAKASGQVGLAGIYSDNTYKTYKSIYKQFVPFLKEQNIQHLNEVTEEHIIGYLRSIMNKYSPYSLDTILSALNKLFNTSVTKKQVGLPVTSYKDVFRGREGKTGRYNPLNWKDQIDVANATGIRRASMCRGQFPVKASNFFQCNGRIYVRLIEKGGRYREATVLKCMEGRLRQIIKERTGKEIHEGQHWDKGQFLKYSRANRMEPKLFTRYTKEINNHAFRRAYATNRYQEILKSLGRPEKQDYRGYDEEVIQTLTLDLGHNRLDVCVEHYLR